MTRERTNADSSVVFFPPSPNRCDVNPPVACCVQVKLEGLQGDATFADLASGVISDVGPDFLKEFRPEVGAMISGQIKDFANELLSSFSVASILDRIRAHTEEAASKRLRLRNRPHLYHYQQLEAERQKRLHEQQQQQQLQHREQADKRSEQSSGE